MKLEILNAKLLDFCEKNGLEARRIKVSVRSHIYELVVLDTMGCGLSKKFGRKGGDFDYEQAEVFSSSIDEYGREEAGLVALKLEDIDVNFMREGTLKASSTYLKCPVALAATARVWRAFSDHEWLRGDMKNYKIVAEEDIDAYLETLADEIQYWRGQDAKLKEVLKQIKTDGKQFKDIIKEKGRRSTAGRQAREDYESLILRLMAKVTHRAEIMQSLRQYNA
jgi:hypothetical protein